MFQKLGTANDWGYKPSDLGICLPEHDLDLMLAYTNTKNRMSLWEEHIREENKPKPKGKKSR
jgi:hypothetical protein